MSRDLSDLRQLLRDERDKSDNDIREAIADQAIFDSIRTYRDRLRHGSLENSKWSDVMSFWPPRLLEGYRADQLLCFFGAGVSIPSGLPAWSTLLTEYFKLDEAILTDDDVKFDALTQAEIASHRIGAEMVQSLLRAKMEGTFKPATSHYLLAALNLPIYITTNYDVLFEQAWRKLYDESPTVIVNDAEIIDDKAIPQRSNPRSCILLKIHGSIDRPHDHLILTRSDYRRHYRTNRRLFDLVQELLCVRHTLFIGFSHRDPEVGRLIEDAIWQFERKQTQAQKVELPFTRSDEPADWRPNLYSLNFRMKAHTPEIYAARGMVALDPPLPDPAVPDGPSSSLARGLIDLLYASTERLDAKLSLQSILGNATQSIGQQLAIALDKLSSYSDEAIRLLSANGETTGFLDAALNELGIMAGQGIYILDYLGRSVAAKAPKGLTNPRRVEINLPFSERPYFRQARTFREPFVSDAFRSIFNGNISFALCVPLIRSNSTMDGLLFSVCQPGQWRIPKSISDAIWAGDRQLSLALIDSDGRLLFPPNPEMLPETPDERQQKGETIESALLDEDATANRGYNYDRMLALSRRDKLTSRLMENIVPLEQDDDVMSLGLDVRLYTVITELRRTRWKLGISDSITLSRAI